MSVISHSNGKVGFASYDRLIIPCIYDDYDRSLPYDDGQIQTDGFVVSIGEKWGVIDYFGNTILDFKYPSRYKITLKKFTKAFQKKIKGNHTEFIDKLNKLNNDASLSYLMSLSGNHMELSDADIVEMNSRDLALMKKILDKRDLDINTEDRFNRLQSGLELRRIDSLTKHGNGQEAQAYYENYVTHYGHSAYIEEVFREQGLLTNQIRETELVNFSNGTYSGQIDEFGVPHGHGIFYSNPIYNPDIKLYEISQAEGTWIRGQKSGRIRQEVFIGNFESENPDDWKINITIKKEGIYAGDICIGAEQIEMRKDSNDGITLYKGEYKDGKFNGSGIAYWNDGTIYDGQWKNGLMNGTGLYILKNGARFNGEFINGVFEGKGTHVTQNGDIYTGEWKNWKMDGFGKLTTNADTYEGIFSKGKFISGNVHLNFEDGLVYDGEYSNNMFNGKGTVIYPIYGDYRTSKIEGHFKDGHYFGECDIYYFNGSHEKKSFGKASYLTVDKQTSLQLSTSDTGKSLLFGVDTDWNVFTVEGLPSWIDMKEKTDSSFTLDIHSNANNSSRAATFFVKAGGKTVTIHLEQEKNKYATSGKINRTWLTYNASRGFGYSLTYGLEIHIDFEVDNLSGKTCEIAVYFEFDNGVILKDYNNNYRTTDGQVAISSNFVPPYTGTRFNDFTLFIPYSELHIASGVHNLRYNIIIFDKSTNKAVCRSGYYNFGLQLY